ncbi:MAG: hypothetical protein P8182_09240 [Deltaproteobacteria bacterium]
MGKTSITILIVILAAGAIIYGGGAIYVRGAPIFYHLDSALGTSVLMDTHYRLMFLLRREENTEEDAFTKVYQDFDKVLKQTSE